jgi:hypothetical protein
MENSKMQPLDALIFLKFLVYTPTSIFGKLFLSPNGVTFQHLNALPNALNQKNNQLIIKNH